jgi:hypothetical protein
MAERDLETYFGNNVIDLAIVRNGLFLAQLHQQSHPPMGRDGGGNGHPRPRLGAGGGRRPMGNFGVNLNPNPSQGQRVRDRRGGGGSGGGAVADPPPPRPQPPARAAPPRAVDSMEMVPGTVRILRLESRTFPNRAMAANAESLSGRIITHQTSAAGGPPTSFTIQRNNGAARPNDTFNTSRAITRRDRDHSVFNVTRKGPPTTRNNQRPTYYYEVVFDTINACQDFCATFNIVTQPSP